MHDKKPKRRRCYKIELGAENPVPGNRFLPALFKQCVPIARGMELVVSFAHTRAYFNLPLSACSAPSNGRPPRMYLHGDHIRYQCKPRTKSERESNTGQGRNRVPRAHAAHEQTKNCTPHEHPLTATCTHKHSEDRQECPAASPRFCHGTALPPPFLLTSGTRPRLCRPARMKVYAEKKLVQKRGTQPHNRKV